MGSLTQDDIGRHVDLSARSVREWERKLGLEAGAYSLDEFRVSYIRALREEAAGRGAAGDIDLPTERALLARSQREGQEIKNEVARGTYAPIELLTDVLANASQAVVERIDQIPASLRRRCPDLPHESIDAVMAEIGSARNEWIRKTASLVSDSLDESDIQEEEPLPEV